MGKFTTRKLAICEAMRIVKEKYPLAKWINDPPESRLYIWSNGKPLGFGFNEFEAWLDAAQRIRDSK